MTSEQTVFMAEADFNTRAGLYLLLLFQWVVLKQAMDPKLLMDKIKGHFLILSTLFYCFLLRIKYVSTPHVLMVVVTTLLHLFIVSLLL